MAAAELSRLITTRRPSKELAWVTLGIVAQLMFSMRFIIQWLVSEKGASSDARIVLVLQLHRGPLCSSATPSTGWIPSSWLGRPVVSQFICATFILFGFASGRPSSGICQRRCLRRATVCLLTDSQ